MIRIQETTKAERKVESNWGIDQNPSILNRIHDDEVNIAIYERDTSALSSEIEQLLDQDIEFRSSGTLEAIMSDVSKAINPSEYSLISQDVNRLLSHFKEVVEVKNFRMLLATVNTNMCRRFHTDVNDLRLLCTYSGPGTLWLTDDNINRRALDDCSGNESIVLDESKVQQAATGAVVLLKGAIYPQLESKAIVHRSPTIEESGEKRLLLRIDTNESLNLWR